MKADKIVVLGRGEVLEEGTHHELLEKGGAYAKLVKAQNLARAETIDIREDDSDVDSEGGEKIIGDPIEERLATVKSWSGVDDDTLIHKDLNLVRSIVLLFRENAHMWPWYLAVLLFSLIGGMFLPISLLRPGTVKKPETSLHCHSYYHVMRNSKSLHSCQR
jgi:ATP-binding cassette subfamily B (MDR/TAP) protein 1